MSLSSCSPASAASEDDLDSMTDYSSAEQSGEEEKEDEHTLEEHVRPPEYYRAHAEEINSADVVPAYSLGTTRQVDGLDELWTE